MLFYQIKRHENLMGISRREPRGGGSVTHVDLHCDKRDHELSLDLGRRGVNLTREPQQGLFRAYCTRWVYE